MVSMACERKRYKDSWPSSDVLSTSRSTGSFASARQASRFGRAVSDSHKLIDRNRTQDGKSDLNEATPVTTFNAWAILRKFRSSHRAAGLAGGAGVAQGQIRPETAT